MRTTRSLSLLMSLAIVGGLAATQPRAGGMPQEQAPDRAAIARGDSVFHGKSGGAICATCHGQDAKGIPGMGPDLTDAAWLHSDGSLRAIEATIRSGVPKPKKGAVAMPPFGGTPLDSARTAAVAAYVYSLRRAK